MKCRYRALRVWGVLAFALLLHGFLMRAQGGTVERSGVPELLVSLPRLAQVMLAGGDAHLAANLSGFRVLVANTQRMQRDDFAVQARLQRDIAWLNPAHEDNYYIAAAFLPWNDQVAAAQEILHEAVRVRVFDWQPTFYLGFGYYHFLKQPALGARQLLVGAERARDQQDQWAMQNLAAKWIEKGYQGDVAADLVTAMADAAPAGAFRNYLFARAQRLRQLENLRAAARDFERVTGAPPRELDDLVRAGVVPELPKDPLGIGFVLGADGMPMMKPGG